MSGPHPPATLPPDEWRRRVPAAALAAVLLGAPACGDNVERVPVVRYAEGVEAELREVAPDEWRIADERVVPDTNDTRVIATGLDGVSDTFALAELRGQPAGALADSTERRRTRRRSSFGPVLLYGLIGNRLGGYRIGAAPRAAAYVDRGTYERVQSGAGARLSRGARRTTVARPAGGRSGYGGGAGGRSYGG